MTYGEFKIYVAEFSGKIGLPPTWESKDIATFPNGTRLAFNPEANIQYYTKEVDEDPNELVALLADDFPSTVEHLVPKYVDAIRDYMAVYDRVYFRELADHLEDKNLPSKGSFAVTPRENENIIFWTGVSYPFLAALKRLVEANEITFDDQSETEFLYQPSFLKLPRLKRKNPRNPRWLPVVICRVETE